MRNKAKNGPISLQAIAGSYVVLLGIDMEEESSKGVLGFAIERIDHSDGDDRRWLPNFKTFKGVDVPADGTVSTDEHPLQTFLWGDFATRKGHEYTYRVVAMRGEPGHLRQGESVEVRVAMEDEAQGTHAVYFNRGVAGSQAYVNKFGNRRPDEVPDREAWRWLSRGLFRALLDFIGKAQGSKYGLRAAVYEFTQPAVVGAFADARRSGADVKIIFDARQVINEEDPKKSKLEPAESNREAIEKAGIQDICIERTANPRDISHNKFVVLLEDGRPVEVWTGSTNMTDGGIFGHSNVGHVVRDPRVAAEYLAYWDKLSTDPEMNRSREGDEIRPWNEETSPVPMGDPPEDSIITIFSPRRTLEALEWYAKRMDSASTGVFITAAFGINDLFEEVLANPKEYLRYVLLESEDEDMERLIESENNRVAVGRTLEENRFERWLKEQLTDLNRHVKYIHTKYMLIDPLGQDPIIISGSANFSDDSTRRNDENMLVIRGDTRVADIYLGEFMRLFNHFYFRSVVGGLGDGPSDPEAGHLKSTDVWREPYYREGSPKYKERLYFAG